MQNLVITIIHITELTIQLQHVQLIDSCQQGHKGEKVLIFYMCVPARSFILVWHCASNWVQEQVSHGWIFILQHYTRAAEKVIRSYTLVFFIWTLALVSFPKHTWLLGPAKWERVWWFAYTVTMNPPNLRNMCILRHGTIYILQLWLKPTHCWFRGLLVQVGTRYIGCSQVSTANKQQN